MTLIMKDAYEGGVLLLTLNKPEKKNALSDDLLAALADEIDAADLDDELRVVVITGAEGCFAAGADINRFNKFDNISCRRDQRPKLWEQIAKCAKPLIAAVEGWCLGAGTELALHCDIVIAGERAQFGLPEVTLGIMPGAGGTQRLPRTIGKSDAMLMALSGDRFDAHQVKAMGLISEVTGEGESKIRCLEIARRIARRAPLAVEAAKRSVLQSYETGLTSGLVTERDLYVQIFATKDRVEGVSAFLQKRQADFKRL
ncbi:MAG: enoyl-CoA hydratase/isomerase family protein [Methylocystaceae bacterium]|nr:enoyl-CoA hydratase/isomerase family protein [Methylocystaceae bacterium]